MIPPVHNTLVNDSVKKKRNNPRSIEYGTYKLIFTSRMWDDALADPNWTRKLPFSNDAFTYINVKKSPLKSQLIKGGVSLVTRGTGQFLTLEPYLFSVDPDWPDQGYDGMEFRWFCRQIKPKKEKWCNFLCPEGEDQLWFSNGDLVPPTRRTADQLEKLRNQTNNVAIYQEGGCFGAGPGAINESLGMITLKSEQFVKVDVTYELMLEIRYFFSLSSLPKLLHRTGRTRGTQLQES